MDKRILKIAAALALYSAFAIYLFRPYLDSNGLIQYARPFSLILGALGCFILSQRWILNFWAAVFAGAIYGFGPYFLSITFYHPLTSAITAAVPWLFIPAALWTKQSSILIKVPLSLLPFAAIMLFFKFAKQIGFFPIHLQTSLTARDLISILSSPVAAKLNLSLLGFYHVPLAVLLMGSYLLTVARKYAVIVLIIAGLAGGFYYPLFSVSPIIWVSISMVCLSIVAGAGMQGLALCGSADGKSISVIIFAILSLAGASALLAVKYENFFANLASSYAYLFVFSTKMYLLAAAALAMILFFAKTHLPSRYLRWAILISAAGLDIFISARFIIDNSF